MEDITEEDVYSAWDSVLLFDPLNPDEGEVVAPDTSGDVPIKEGTNE